MAEHRKMKKVKGYEFSSYFMKHDGEFLTYVHLHQENLSGRAGIQNDFITAARNNYNNLLKEYPQKLFDSLQIDDSSFKEALQLYGDGINPEDRLSNFAIDFLEGIESSIANSKIRNNYDISSASEKIKNVKFLGDEITKTIDTVGSRSYGENWIDETEGMIELLNIIKNFAPEESAALIAIIQNSKNPSSLKSAVEKIKNENGIVTADGTLVPIKTAEIQSVISLLSRHLRSLKISKKTGYAYTDSGKIASDTKIFLDKNIAEPLVARMITDTLNQPFKDLEEDMNKNFADSENIEIKDLNIVESFSQIKVNEGGVKNKVDESGKVLVEVKIKEKSYFIGITIKASSKNYKKSTSKLKIEQVGKNGVKSGKIKSILDFYPFSLKSFYRGAYVNNLTEEGKKDKFLIGNYVFSHIADEFLCTLNNTNKDFAQLFISGNQVITMYDLLTKMKDLGVSLEPSVSITGIKSLESKQSSARKQASKKRSYAEAWKRSKNIDNFFNQNHAYEISVKHEELLKLLS